MRSAYSLSRFSEALSAPRSAANWRRSALICGSSTSICASGASKGSSESSALLSHLARPGGVVAGAGKSFIESLIAITLGLHHREPRAELRELVVEVHPVELFQRQQIVQLRASR